MLESQPQSSASLMLWLYTTQIERMMLFYEILGFIVVQDREFIDGRRIVMALHDNAGAQLRLAEPRSDADTARKGKQFFCISSFTPFIPHKVLAARGFSVSEYNAARPECFLAHDPEGNEVFVGEASIRRETA